jgi:hypothetical protein
MHGKGMENLVTTGKIPGKIDRGRQRENILDGICRWLGVKDNKDIFREVRDRTRGRNMIANAFKQGTGKIIFTNVVKQQTTVHRFLKLRRFNK